MGALVILVLPSGVVQTQVASESPEEAARLRLLEQRLGPACRRLAADPFGAIPTMPSLEPTTTPFVLRRHAGLWAVAYEGHETLVPNIMGMTYIALLLQHPTRRFRADDLESLAFGDGAAAAENEDIAGTIPGSEALLDDESVRAYQQRLAELQSKKTSIGLMPGEQAEVEAIQGELRRGLGVGGKRRTRGAVDLARQRVTKGLHRAYRALEPALPRMAQHLRTSIKTGREVSYQPDRSVPWDIQRFDEVVT